MSDITRLQACVEQMAKPLAYEYHLDIICTIPDLQSKERAQDWADRNWIKFVPEEYRDLWEGKNERI